jgi:hypothetical protein
MDEARERPKEAGGETLDSVRLLGRGSAQAAIWAL